MWQRICVMYMCIHVHVCVNMHSRTGGNFWFLSQFFWDKVSHRIWNSPIWLASWPIADQPVSTLFPWLGFHTYKHSSWFYMSSGAWTQFFMFVQQALYSVSQMPGLSVDFVNRHFLPMMKGINQKDYSKLRGKGKCLPHLPSHHVPLHAFF